jgi:TolB-like protein/DNA-binding winged helix-turn-helix (wHTH) protein
MAESTQNRTVYKFGDFQVDLLSGDIRKHSRRIHVQEKPYQILRMLLERPGEVVTREALRQRLWPADTYVDFDANLNTSLNRLRYALGDNASEQTLIKTVPRQGYRFIGAVAEVDMVSEESKGAAASEELNRTARSLPAGGPTATTLQARGRPIWMGLLLLVVFLGCLAYFGWRSHSGSASDVRGRMTVLVIPLTAMDGKQDRDLLGDSLTEETITRLGRVAPQQISVIARSTAMQYRESRQTVSQMASEQHADYVLEGGYRRQGDRLRITAQLFDARNQGSVWSEVYERDAADMFTVEREVTEQIANSVSQRLLPHSNAHPTTPSQ